MRNDRTWLCMRSFFIVFIVVTLSFLAACAVSKPIIIAPDKGEAIKKEWANFYLGDFNTGLEYGLDEKQLQQRIRNRSVCTVILNDLFYAGEFFRRNFYARNGLTGIETVSCRYDECLPITPQRDCHAKFIIYTDTINEITTENAGPLAKMLIQSDKYYKESIYKVHFQVYILFSSEFDERRAMPKTEVSFNTNIFVRKKAVKGERWVPIRAIDIYEKQYQNFENSFKEKLRSFCDSLLTQRSYLKKN